ncbi:hypothetical protein BU16DRAFT_533679 [Lophium mytilinum]|uniref:Uncharacterized protein n=1 Tax=Lophium mytilinum TaxID=390894 RepID=A0A6A6R8X9_9PEZI|nr:hypothetical protein BU16DRAFT_533679 [Lophium mytilinum]
MATIARLHGRATRVVRCARVGCGQYIRTDVGDDALLLQDTKDFCVHCEVSVEDLKEEVIRMAVLFDKVNRENYAGRWKMILQFPLSPAEKQTWANFRTVCRRYDRMRLLLANARLDILGETDKLAASQRVAVKSATGVARPIQSLPTRRKRARSESPDLNGEQDKRVRREEAMTKRDMIKKTKRKVSFSQPPDLREMSGYRVQQEYLRENEFYTPGRHAASPKFTLVDTSGLSLSFDDFYSGKEKFPDAITDARMRLRGLFDDDDDDDDTDMDEDSDYGDESLLDADKCLQSTTEASLESLPVGNQNDLQQWHRNQQDEGVVMDDFDPYVQLELEMQDESFEDSGFTETLASGVEEPKGLERSIASASTSTSPPAVAASESLDGQALRLGGQRDSAGGEGWRSKSSFPTFQGSLSVFQDSFAANEMSLTLGRSDQLDKAYHEMEGIAEGFDGERVIR